MGETAFSEKVLPPHGHEVEADDQSKDEVFIVGEVNCGFGCENAKDHHTRPSEKLLIECNRVNKLSSTTIINRPTNSLSFVCTNLGWRGYTVNNTSFEHIIVAVVGQVDKEDVSKCVAYPSISDWKSNVDRNEFCSSHFFKSVIMILYFLVNENQYDS